MNKRETNFYLTEAHISNFSILQIIKKHKRKNLKTFLLEDGKDDADVWVMLENGNCSDTNCNDHPSYY